ncbi:MULTISPECIES: PD40 domain-containing protein [unclassified Lentimicrobium]|uniref:PD40 domain-containing protein n=1 Tax=unclassified Lentimicrobium TaxID=2677434 RepID=UPI0015563724|nr:MULTISPECIES: PD40 domain-containing protein [unclassified Lentimicrobium]NPD47978.1 hypothetical protein [Lentimicrobium sp. S6]NPD86927.1 hypothetical protein [Lentimicrobium sp. L6]
MKKTIMKTTLTILTLFIILNSTFSQKKAETNSDLPIIKGSYLGQKPPGLIPEIFALGILPNPGKFALGINFLQEGTELYYSQWERPFPQIRFRKIVNGTWTQDTIASFSGEFMDWDLTAAPDGKRLYFSSKRPLEKDGEPKKDADIWYVERIEGLWSEPKNLGLSVNSDSNEVHPTIAKNGNIYFFGKHGPNISVTKNENSNYLEPEKLGDEINSDSTDLDPIVAPDESYLIFHSRRSGGEGENDLYISFKDIESNSWTKAVNMGKLINTENSDYCARISLDGKYLFFSRRNPVTESSDFYWVDAKVIENLKPKELKK